MIFFNDFYGFLCFFNGCFMVVLCFFCFFYCFLLFFDVFCYIYGFPDVFLEWFWYGFNMFFYMVVGYFNICFQLKTREIFDFL
jgi:hypothetical protein